MPIAIIARTTGIQGTFIVIILKSFKSQTIANIKTINANIGNFFAMFYKGTRSI